MSDQNAAGVATRAKKRIFYGWIIVAASFPVATISYGNLYTFGVFLIPFRETFSASTAAISGAYSMSVFLYMALAPFSGLAVDRYGPRATTIFSSVLLVSGFLLTSRVTEVWQLYFTYGLIGMGMCASYTPLTTTVSRWFSRRRGMALGIHLAGVGAGPPIMVQVASYLTLAFDWRVAYMVLAATLLLLIPAAFFLKRSPEEIGEVPDGRAYTAARTLPGKSDAVASGKVQGLTLREALRTRAFWCLATVYFMIGLNLQTIMAHVVAYSQGKGLTPIAAAAVLSTVSGMSILGRLTLGPAGDVLGRRRVLAISVFGEGLLALLVTQASPAWSFFLFAIVFGLCYGGHVPQLPALVGETMGMAHMGIVLGSVGFFWGVGGAIGPLLAGRIVDVTGSYVWAFVIGGCGMLIATIAALGIKKS